MAKKNKKKEDETNEVVAIATTLTRSLQIVITSVL